MGGYTKEVIEILNEELKTTDTTGEMLYPILEEVTLVTNCDERRLLCDKLLIEARLFNRNLK